MPIKTLRCISDPAAAGRWLYTTIRIYKYIEAVTFYRLFSPSIIIVVVVVDPRATNGRARLST